VYFYNSATQESSWEHPLDGHYRELVAYWRDAYARGERPREAAVEKAAPEKAAAGKAAADAKVVILAKLTPCLCVEKD
jgi:hypothetical protein